MITSSADYPKLHELAVVERTIKLHATLSGRLAREPMKLEVLRNPDTCEYLAHLSLMDSSSNPVWVHWDALADMRIDRRITDPEAILDRATEQALRWLATRCV